jgi:hypothetical protein
MVRVETDKEREREDDAVTRSPGVVAAVLGAVSLLSAGCDCGDREIGSDTIAVPEGSNAYVCECECDLHPPFPIPEQTNCDRVEFCLPPILNPNRPEGHLASPEELQADCQGRVHDFWVASGQAWANFCDIMESSDCRCGVVPDEETANCEPTDEPDVASAFNDPACDEDCTPVPIAGEIDRLSRMKHQACADGSGECPATVIPADCGRGDVGPVCMTPSADPTRRLPDPGIFLVANPHSFGDVTSGEITIQVGDDDPLQTSLVAGFASFYGGPCPGESCEVGMSFSFRPHEVRFEGELWDGIIGDVLGLFGSVDVRIRDTYFHGVSEPGAVALDPEGHGEIAAGALQVAGRGTARTRVCVPFDCSSHSDTRAYLFTNPEPFDVAVDWEGHAFSLDGAFHVDAGADEETEPRVYVLVPLDGRIFNEPPAADAGADQVGEQAVDCTSPQGALVTLDGSGSTDPEDNIALFVWKRGLGLRAEPLGLGQPVVHVQQATGATQEYSLWIQDTSLQGADDTTTVQVVDRTPPVIDRVELERDCLWPPNHQYVRFALGEDLLVAGSDVCDSAPLVRVANVVSDQVDDAQGDGATTKDVIFSGGGFCIRAERAPSAWGRTYTVTVEAVDHFGNTTTRDVAIRVPRQDSSCPLLDSDDLLSDDQALTECVFPEPGRAGAAAGLLSRRPSLTQGCGVLPLAGEAPLTLGGALLLLLACRLGRRR